MPKQILFSSEERSSKIYRLAEAATGLISRREVFKQQGKIQYFADGKSPNSYHAPSKGDWRSGYYRDQTWMFMC
jgi:hypothetical protein